MKEITKNIKENKFHKVYLINGDEGYLVLQARQMLKKAMIREGDDMNYRLYEENKIDLSAFADLASTFPFFSEKRVLILNQTNILKTGKDEFLKILQNLPDTTCIIICEYEKADSRTKLYKWIKANGYIAEFFQKNQKESTLMTFLAKILAKEKKQIRENDARYMISLIGNDYFRIRNEAEKLIAYLGEESVVSREAIDAVISEQIENKIYDMITAIAMKDQNQALKMYHDLIILKEEPIAILSLLVRQYRILTILKSMAGQRKPESEMAKVAGIPVFAVRKYAAQLRIYGLKQLEKCLENTVAMETEAKSGLIDRQIGVEMLIISLIGE